MARTDDRMVQLKRTAAVAQAYGVTCDVIAASEAGDLYPIMATADLKGAVWLPGDGKANPADLTLALAKGARNRGVKICEGTRVTGAVTQSGGGKRIRSSSGPTRPGNPGASPPTLSCSPADSGRAHWDASSASPCRSFPASTITS